MNPARRASRTRSSRVKIGVAVVAFALGLATGLALLPRHVAPEAALSPKPGGFLTAAAPSPTAEPPSEPNSPVATPALEPLSCDGVPLAAPSVEDLPAALDSVAASWGVDFEAAWYDPEAGVVVQTGELPNLAAWSTAKVPLALAVIQADQGDTYAASISSALRISDNDEALRLWRSLGDDDTERSAAVADVLQQAGDDTEVPTTQLYPPFSVFGQTQWTTTAQVTFALQLPCLMGAETVIDHMSHISSGQSWGLGSLPEAVFKGGWGPTGGGYLVRQFGWYTEAGGHRVLMALAVQADSFDIGVAALNAMADELA